MSKYDDEMPGPLVVATVTVIVLLIGFVMGLPAGCAMQQSDQLTELQQIEE